MLVISATIVLLTGAILGDTIIKDNPAQFKAVATDGSGKKIPVSGEMDTIQVFDIHPAGENRTDPGLNIDINVTPLNETSGLVHPTTKSSNPNLSQVTSTFTLPSDYSKILPPTAAFDEAALPFQDEVQNPVYPAMMPPDLTTPAGINSGHWNKSTPQFYPASNENMYTTTVKPATDNPFLTALGQNSNPFLTNLFNFGANQNPFNAFSGSPIGNSSTLTDQNESPFKFPNTTENPFNTSSAHPFPNPFFPTFGQNANPLENPFNMSTHPFSSNPFAPAFGQNTNPFNIFNPPAPNFFNFPTAPPANPFAPADKNANPFGTFPPNPFFPEFKPTPKPPANPFKPFTPTSAQNMLPLGGSLFKENPFSTGGFPTATSPNPFLPNFGGPSKSLFGGKPSRVTGPNPDDSIVVVPRSADYNETASTHKDSLLGKLFNLFGSRNSSDQKILDYDSQMPPANNSAPDYSDMMAGNHPGNTDFINPHIYKAYFDPTMWNKFTNITDFDDTNSLGNAVNPFAAFNPAASPLAFMKNVNPWSPGNVNNPWNPNNFNQAMLNLTSLMKTPTSYDANFNFPSFGAQSPWNINASTPGLVEILHNRSRPEFNISSLESVNTSGLSPQAFAAGDTANTTHRPLPMLQMPEMNLLTDLPGAMNISDLMKNIGDSINLLTGNSSQALLLKSLIGDENAMNWPPAVLPQSSSKPPPAPLPSPAASFGVADEPNRLSDVHKYIEELPIPQPKKASPIEIETIPAVNVLADGKQDFYGDDSKVAEDEARAGLINGTVATEAPQNGALTVLSSWMMVIGIVVGAIAQKLCN